MSEGYGVPTGSVPRKVPVDPERITATECCESLAAIINQGPLKDSGVRREVGTGAVRDRSTGKGRFDLLPLFGLLAASLQMEDGAIKYSERNWEKGMPLSWFVDSALRHLLKFNAGFDDEPHLRAALWNLMCLAEGQERIKRGLWPAALDDLPKTFAGQSPSF